MNEYLKENPHVNRYFLVSHQVFPDSTKSLMDWEANDVLLGLEYLHTRNIIHGDLKGVCIPSACLFDCQRLKSPVAGQRLG